MADMTNFLYGVSVASLFWAASNLARHYAQRYRARKELIRQINKILTQCPCDACISRRGRSKWDETTNTN